jgi:hypothetical protein
MAQASSRRGPGSIPGQTMWGLWQTSGVAYHHSTHALFIFVYEYRSLLPGETSEPTEKHCLFGNHGTLDRKTLNSLWISASKRLSWIKKMIIPHHCLYSCFNSNFSRHILSNSIVYSKKLATICIQQLWLAETWCCCESISVSKGKMSDLHFKHAELLN